jgi:hypothetical protein
MTALNVMTASLFLGYVPLSFPKAAHMIPLTHRTDREYDGIGLPILLVLSDVLVSKISHVLNILAEINHL